jgi:hypothetical protein
MAFSKKEFFVVTTAVQTTGTVVVPSSPFNLSMTGLVFKFFALFIKIYYLKRGR